MRIKTNVRQAFKFGILLAGTVLCALVLLGTTAWIQSFRIPVTFSLTVKKNDERDSIPKIIHQILTSTQTSSNIANEEQIQESLGDRKPELVGGYTQIFWTKSHLQHLAAELLPRSPKLESDTFQEIVDELSDMYGLAAVAKFGGFYISEACGPANLDHWISPHWGNTSLVVDTTMLDSGLVTGIGATRGHPVVAQLLKSAVNTLRSRVIDSNDSYKILEDYLSRTSEKLNMSNYGKPLYFPNSRVLISSLPLHHQAQGNAILPTIKHSDNQNAIANGAIAESHTKSPKVPIPRIIHIPYKWYETVPSSWGLLQKNHTTHMETWIKHNPAWSVKKWDHATSEKFIRDYFPGEVDRAFNGTKLAKVKVAILRYAALYHYGGVFVNSDVDCLHPLDSWLTNEFSTIAAVADFSNSTIRIRDWLVASKPQHPIAYNSLNQIVNSLKGWKKSKFSSPQYATANTGSPLLASELAVHANLFGESLDNGVQTHRSSVPGTTILRPRSKLSLVVADMEEDQKGAENGKSMVYWNNDALWDGQQVVSPIPMRIFQTYKSSHLRDWVQELMNRTSWFQSWPAMNPGFEHRVLNDSDANLFMKENFPGRIYDAYTKMPLIVLRSDLLRYALLYKYGGIYADSDCECTRPFSSWILGYEEATMVVSLEWYANFHKIGDPIYQRTQLVQWAFAAAPKHPVFDVILKGIADKVLDQMTVRQLEDTSNVEGIGGPQVFTQAVEDYMKKMSGGTETVHSWKREDDVELVYYPKSKVLLSGMNYFYGNLGEEQKQNEGRFFINHYFGGFQAGGWRTQPPINREDEGDTLNGNPAANMHLEEKNGGEN